MGESTREDGLDGEAAYDRAMMSVLLLTFSPKSQRSLSSRFARCSSALACTAPVVAVVPVDATLPALVRRWSPVVLERRCCSSNRVRGNRARMAASSASRLAYRMLPAWSADECCPKWSSPR